MLIRVVTFLLLSNSLLNGVVAPNPFLRPGSNRMPPPPSKPVIKPKPITRPNFANEIEFKGYFILKGQAYFSLFNKKVKHAEWITINEKTYEEFTAEKFDLETETLTILFEGQSFELKLIQAKSGTALPSSGKITPNIPRPSASIPRSNTPKYMPPKPKTTPQIPTWLVNRNNPSRARSSTASSSTSRGFGTGLPGLPSPGSVPRRTFSSSPKTNTNAPSNQFTNPESRPEPSTVTQTNPQRSASTPSEIQDSSTGSLNNTESSTNGGNGNSNIEIDLENLPPPPPPPNILPPSPPPNLLPSREE